MRMRRSSAILVERRFSPELNSQFSKHLANWRLPNIDRPVQRLGVQCKELSKAELLF